MSNGRIGWGLGSSLWLLAVSINILVAITQVECSELNGSPIYLTVTRHANSFFLIKDPSLVVVMNGSTRSSLSSCLGCCGSKSTCIGSIQMLLLRSRDRCRSNATRCLSGIPRIGGGARGSTSRRRVRIVSNLFKVCFGEFVLRGRQSNFGFDNFGFFGGSSRFDNGSCFFDRFRIDRFKYRFGVRLSSFDGRFRFNSLGSSFRGRGLLWLRRSLRSSRLSQHARPSLDWGHSTLCDIYDSSSNIADRLANSLLLFFGLSLGLLGSPG